MERKDLGLGTRQYKLDMKEDEEDIFYEAILEYWLEGKIPSHMVYINHCEEELEVSYGYA